MARILAVDDSKLMLQIVTLTLTNAGHDLLQAEDGDNALKLASDNEVDLIITDVNMPNMDGITLVKKLRELPQHKATPILLLTTESEHEKKMEGKQAGASGWIVKPIDPEALLETVTQVLG